MRHLAKMLAAFVIGLASVGLAAPPDHAGGPGGNGGPPPHASAASANPAAVSGPDVGPAATPSPAAAEPKANKGGSAEPSGQTKKPKSQETEPPEHAKATKSGAFSDKDAAQQAVQQNEALPLSRIIVIAEKQTEGRVINARLLRVSGVLLYQLTILNGEGRSWRKYYSAASGNPVVLP
jgi:hypothetical protein